MFETEEQTKSNVRKGMKTLQHKPLIFLKRQHGQQMIHMVQGMALMASFMPQSRDGIKEALDRVQELLGFDDFAEISSPNMMAGFCRHAVEQKLPPFGYVLDSQNLLEMVKNHPKLSTEWHLFESKAYWVDVIFQAMEKVMELPQKEKDEMKVTIEVNKKDLRSNKFKTKFDDYEKVFQIEEMSNATKAAIKKGKDDLMSNTKSHPDQLTVAEHIDAAIIVGEVPVAAFFLVAWPESKSEILRELAILVTLFSMKPYNTHLPKTKANKEKGKMGGNMGLFGILLMCNLMEIRLLGYDAINPAMPYYSKSNSYCVHTVNGRIHLGLGISRKFWSKKSLDEYGNCIAMYMRVDGIPEPIEFKADSEGYAICKQMLHCWDPAFPKAERRDHTHERPQQEPEEEEAEN